MKRYDLELTNRVDAKQVHHWNHWFLVCHHTSSRILSSGCFTGRASFRGTSERQCTLCLVGFHCQCVLQRLQHADAPDALKVVNFLTNFCPVLIADLFRESWLTSFKGCTGLPQWIENRARSFVTVSHPFQNRKLLALILLKPRIFKKRISFVKPNLMLHSKWQIAPVQPDFPPEQAVLQRQVSPFLTALQLEWVGSWIISFNHSFVRGISLTCKVSNKITK